MKAKGLSNFDTKYFLLAIATIFSTYGCQKELPLPEEAVITPIQSGPKYVKVSNDTFKIRAFYGHQGITPPSVGTVIFPQYDLEVPTVNKLAFMSAYTGLNGYGDSANTVKKNALNEYNGEFYNTDVNAQGNASITITPIRNPVPDYSAIAPEGNVAYDKFFKQSNQLLISIKLINGIWEHQDTATDGKITIYQMDKLLMVATESVETGLATQNGVQKLKNGQSETYIAFVNQRGFILHPKALNDDFVAWYPRLYK